MRAPSPGCRSGMRSDSLVELFVPAVPFVVAEAFADDCAGTGVRAARETLLLPPAGEPVAAAVSRLGGAAGGGTSGSCDRAVVGGWLTETVAVSVIDAPRFVYGDSVSSPRSNRLLRGESRYNTAVTVSFRR